MPDRSSIEAGLVALLSECKILDAATLKLRLRDLSKAVEEEEAQDTRSPAEKVFQTYELATLIFSYLPSGALFKAQQICKTALVVAYECAADRDDLYTFTPVRRTVHGMLPASFLRPNSDVDFLPPTLAGRDGDLYFACHLVQRHGPYVELRYRRLFEAAYFQTHGGGGMEGGKNEKATPPPGARLIVPMSDQHKEFGELWRKVRVLQAGKMDGFEDELSPRVLEIWESQVDHQKSHRIPPGVGVALDGFGTRHLSHDCTLEQVYDTLCEMVLAAPNSSV